MARRVLHGQSASEIEIDIPTKGGCRKDEEFDGCEIGKKEAKCNGKRNEKNLKGCD